MPLEPRRYHRPSLHRAAVVAAGAAATLLVATSAPAAPGHRPWPHLIWELNGVDCTYDAAKCLESDWINFLHEWKLEPLEAPPGGRAYRWLWVNAGWEMNFAPGWVELVVDGDGKGRIRSVWHPRSAPIGSAEVADFEAALGKSAFAAAAEEEDARGWTDYPPEQLMEADVGGEYHFVHRVGGIRETGIRDAGVVLENDAKRIR